MEPDIEQAKKWLNTAIQRHERHMNGTEDTSEASQMLMMDEMKYAMQALEKGYVITTLDYAKNSLQAAMPM